MKNELFLEQLIQLDFKLQKGYEYSGRHEDDKTVKIWCEAWNEMMDYMKKNKLKSFESFNKIFNGRVYVINWINDFDSHLYCIITNSRNIEIIESYGNIRIQLNEQIQHFIELNDELGIENAKRAIAETYFLMGNAEKGEALFKSYLEKTPTWGWGWIGWSDQYWMCKGEKPDFVRGEELLLKALEVPGLKDKKDVEDRLLELYSESEQYEKLQSLEKKILE